MSRPAARFNISNATCDGLAGPVLANVNWPGLARAALVRSAIVRYGELLLTTMTCGDCTRLQIGSKLVIGS